MEQRANMKFKTANVSICIGPIALRTAGVCVQAWLLSASTITYMGVHRVKDRDTGSVVIAQAQVGAPLCLFKI